MSKPSSWIGTFFLLLSILAFDAAYTQDNPLISFKNIYFEGASPSHAVTKACLEDNSGNLWVGTSNGLYRYDGMKLHHYVHSNDSTSLIFNDITTLFQDKKGVIWIGTMEKGLNIYNPLTDNFTRLSHPELNNSRIWHIIEDANQNLWIATREGLFHFNRKENKFSYDVSSTLYDPQPPAFQHLAFDPKNENIIWIGSKHGLFRFDKTSMKLSHVRMPYTYKEQPQVLLMSLSTIGDTIWAGSWGSAMVSYDTVNKKWNRKMTGIYEPNDGKWHEIIWEILQKDKQHFWITSSQGFGTYNIVNNTYHFYEPDSHNPSSIAPSFYNHALLETHNKFIIVGGFGGFSIGSLNTVQKEDKASFFEPTIQQINIDSKVLTSDTSHSQLKTLVLEDDDKDISFGLCWPGHYDQKIPLFRCKLKGYDKQWQVLKNQNTIRYTNLTAGDYQFIFEASMDGKEWRKGSKILKVEKNVHFWKRSWFIALLVLAFSLLILLFNHLKINSVRKEESLKAAFNEKLAEVEMAALRAQMNPHFMFNSLNSIKYYILNEEVEVADKYLTKFSLLMRAVLNNSKFKLVTLREDLEALNLYIELEALRFTDDFDFKQQIEADINSFETYIPPLLIQPYVENAIWHGLMHKKGDRKLTIFIEKINHQLQITIEDNGIGRDAAKTFKSKSASKQKSHGMKISKGRVELIEKAIGRKSSVRVIDLKDSTGISTGTKIIIHLPYIEEPLENNALIL